MLLNNTDVWAVEGREAESVFIYQMKYRYSSYIYLIMFGLVLRLNSTAFMCAPKIEFAVITSLRVD